MPTVNQNILVVNEDADRIEAYTPFNLKDVCKSIPGARWNPEIKAWTYPATPMTAHTIHTRMPPRVARSASFINLVKNRAAQQARDADTKSATDLPPVPFSKFDAWNHQKQAFWFSKDKPGTMLAMDMGTGKTKVSIDLLQNAGAKRVLIICPKKVVPVWPREFAKHATKPHRVIALNRGAVTKRVEEARWTRDHADKNPSDEMLVFVVNYESIWREPMEGFLTYKWDFVIADESHKIKAANGVASRTLAKIGKRARQRICMTGTPMPHSPLDAYAQYRFLAPEVFGTSYQVFKNTYAVFGGYGGHELLAYQNQDDLNARFYSVAFRVTKDVLDLPPFMHVERTFELGPEAQRTYSTLDDEFIQFVEQGETVTVANALVKLLRMQQVTSGYLPTDDGRILAFEPEKEELLGEVIDEISLDEPVVIFCRFTRDLDAVRRMTEKAGREYMELSGRQDDWVEWSHKSGGEVLAVQIQAGGVGIDLSRARYCVYYSLGFSLGDYDQSLARIHRPGQERPVVYVHLVAEGTVDRKVYDALANRRAVVEAILEEIREEN
jgi:SNF2 family DNA or RNA helicase